MPTPHQQPRDVFNELQNEINRLFNHRWPDHDSSAATAQWVPPTDIDEYPDRFVLYMDVPGIEPAAIEMTLDNGVLTVSGQREREAETANLQRQRRERAQGRFYRRFTLPETVDAEGVKASGRNGVLEVVIPKRSQHQPRRIAVES